MKKALILLFLLISFSLSANISLVSMKGYVQIRENEKADWRIPTTGQKLKPGFIIYTGFNSSAIIQSKNAKIEVKPLSQISIASLLVTKDKVSKEWQKRSG